MDSEIKDTYELAINHCADLAEKAGFDSIVKAIEYAAAAKQKPIVAYMHDGENRFDVVHAAVKQVWDGARPSHLEHYTIPLVRKD